MKILIVDSDPSMRLTLTDGLERQGHEVVPLATAAELRERMAPAQPWVPDVLVLDTVLVDGDGLPLMAEARRRWPSAGVMALASRVRMEDVIEGLSLGADHYLTKPVQLPVIQATLTALARRLHVNGFADQRQAREGWSMASGSRNLRRPDGRQVQLTEAEYRVLNRLALSPFVPVRRADLVLALGEDPASYDNHNLDVLMYRLRRKLAPPGVAPLRIQSAYRVGYVCSTPVHIVPHGGTPTEPEGHRGYGSASAAVMSGVASV